jgi:hypothetical protein
MPVYRKISGFNKNEKRGVMKRKQSIKEAFAAYGHAVYMFALY